MKQLFLSLGAALVALLSACAVKPPLTPPRDAPASPTPAAAPSKPAPLFGANDAAWAKVVEAAQKEARVTVYSFGFIGDSGPALAEAFFREYGIKTEIITGPGAGLTERVRTEQRVKNVVADVLDTSASLSITLLREGYLVAVANELPVLREDVWLTSPRMDNGGHILGHNLSFGSLWINTDLVKSDEAPKSWADTLHPTWKGKILSTDALTSPVPDRFIHMLTRYEIVKPDFFPRLAAQRLIIPTGVGPRPPFTALARGEGAILAYGSDASGAVVIAEGGHIKPVVFTEGVISVIGGIQAIKNAPHPNAAKVFINFLLSQEGHEIETRMKLAGSVRNDVPDRSVYARLKPFRIVASTMDDEEQINKNFSERVAAKALGLR